MNSLVVADYYQLRRSNGKFVKEGKELIRAGVKLEQRIVDDVNDDFETGGKLYVVNEKATKKNHEERAENQARKAQEAELRSLGGSKAVEAIAAVIDSKKEKAPKAEKTEAGKTEKVDDEKVRKTEPPVED